ncbi:MAG: hypothetical protein QW101_02425 [Ignisphaera sp.]|uniref:Uncharacterized protein n=1 Tax=Ignisphaera aggregans TaxID=334771 RepID=A0A7J3MZ16_9CREN
MPKKKVRTPEGFIVDEESGEVLDDTAIDFEHPEYRAYSYEEYQRKAHYEPLQKIYENRLCVDDGVAERIISQMIPGLVEILKVYLRKSLCSANRDEVYRFLSSLWGNVGAEIVRGVIERRLTMSLPESQAYDLAGLDGLTVFRCLKNTGLDENSVVEAIKSFVESSEPRDSYTYILVRDLFTSIRTGKQSALIRWISKPIDNAIDMDYAVRVFNVEPKKLRNVVYLVVKTRGLGVQITSTKIDISSRYGEESIVAEAVDYLSRRLGVELSKPLPMIATVIVKMPFKINLQTLSRFEKASSQGNRIKIMGQGYTALVYPSTVNMYVNLAGTLNRINVVLAQALPTICTYAEKKR